MKHPQVSALEDLLGFLSGLAPFKSLSRELLTALAVFVRPMQLGQGQLLAVAGSKVEGLIIIQVEACLYELHHKVCFDGTLWAVWLYY